MKIARPPLALLLALTLATATCRVAHGAVPNRSLHSITPWQDGALNMALGNVNSASTINGWHPLNLGVETSNSSVPLFAMGPKQTLYLANSVGIWRYQGRQWMLLSPIPGSTMNTPYVVAFTVSKLGVLYVATTGLHQCIWMWSSGRWLNISDKQTQNIRFLSWSPDEHLLAGTNQYPKMVSRGTAIGPAPTPSLGLFEYVAGHWQSEAQWLRGQDPRFARTLAVSPTRQRAIAGDLGIYEKSFFGWKLVSDMAATDLAWWHQWLVAGTYRGLEAYDGKRWTVLPNTPSILRTANITSLYVNQDALLVEAQNGSANAISAWLDVHGVWSRVPYTGVGVHYVGLSPNGIPTMELQGYAPKFQIWQQLHGRWHSLHLPSAVTTYTNNPTYLDLHEYNPQNIAWSSNGLLTISTEQHGVWQLHGKTWVQVGGPIDKKHTYSTGSIGFTKSGVLVASVKEEIPPPPTTPRMLHTMTWIYKNRRWTHVQYPSGVTENLVQGVSIAPNGDLILLVSSAGFQIWTHHADKWTLTAPSTGLPTASGHTNVAFAPDGKLTLSITGFQSPDKNGLYQLMNGAWHQILTNPSWLRKRDTYWSQPAWLPDGSIVFSVMNDDGYHLWRYAHGTWHDLGLSNQRIGQLFVLPGGWLYAVSDAYVCWVRKLT